MNAVLNVLNLDAYIRCHPNSGPDGPKSCCLDDPRGALRCDDVSLGGAALLQPSSHKWQPTGRSLKRDLCYARDSYTSLSAPC